MSPEEEQYYNPSHDQFLTMLLLTRLEHVYYYSTFLGAPITASLGQLKLV